MRNEGKREINGKSLNGMIAMDWAFNANGRKTDGSKHEMWGRDVQANSGKKRFNKKNNYTSYRGMEANCGGLLDRQNLHQDTESGVHVWNQR